FRHAERAAISHSARRLVGVDAVDQYVRSGKIVGTGDDAEETSRPFACVGTSIECAVVRNGIDAQSRDLAVSSGGNLRLPVGVAGKRSCRQVFDAVLD